MSASEALRRIRQAREEKATALDLSQLGLRTIPREIGHLVDLQKLDIGANTLTRLPSELGRLRKLRTLYACGNALSELPADFGALTLLRTLSSHETRFELGRRG